MDAFVQLALIEKAKRVFAADGSVMLSFPLLEPIGFTADELEACTEPESADDYAVAADFSRVVNLVVSDMVASTTERKLWDVYRDVLDRAQVGDVSTEGDEDHSAADILYADGPDGTRVESEALKRYRQYRDAWFVAREDYAAHKLSGELSEDPAEHQQWTDTDEPALRAAIDAATSAWDTLGQRAEIEKALEEERNTAFRDPRRRWAEWSNAFNPDIDMATAGDGGRYAPTGFSPRNFAERDGWLTFDMSAAEMRALVEQAPDGLKRVLDDDRGSSIEHVSFEYRSVALVRPWFHPEALTSRIWRSSDPELTLSDGQDPPTGACPAYASACVFVRNVEVTTRGSAAGPASPEFALTLDPKLLTVRRDLRAEPRLRGRPTVRDHRSGVRDHRSATPASLPAAAARPIAFQMLKFNTFAKVSVPLSAAPAVAPVAAGNRLRLDTVRASERVRARAPVTDTPAPAPPTPPPTPDREEISILAFVCKRLPKAPDPAPELDWGDGTERAQSYVVVTGDTLGKIAAKVYGDSAQWKKIYQANRAMIGPNPDKIKVGQEFTLP